MNKKISKFIIFIFLFFVLILIVLKYYRCPVKLIFGLSCPTCGITRAVMHALKLDFSAAFHFHMLWPVVIIGLIAFTLYKLKLIKVNKNKILLILYIICIVNLLYYFYRLFNDSKIVYFAFNESLIFKIFKIFVQ